MQADFYMYLNRHFVLEHVLQLFTFSSEKPKYVKYGISLLEKRYIKGFFNGFGGRSQLCFVCEVEY